MQVGDLKYKFTDLNGEQQECVIPATEIRSGRRQGLSNKQAIMKYLFENGYAVEKVDVKMEKKTRKSTRKPNETKAALIKQLQDAMASNGEVVVINPERQLQVVIDGTTYEFTLVQKRGKK